MSPTHTAKDKESDAPATRGMLFAVRDELKAESREFRNEMNARFSDIDARFSSIDARFSSIDARFSSLDAKMEKILTAVSQMQLSNEEQRADNRITREYLIALSQRTDQLEAMIASKLS